MDMNNPFQNTKWNSPQSQMYNDSFIKRTSLPSMNNIPVRVVFSPEQIAPQEIPTNGTPALFPLSDGSCIIAISLLPNGCFDQRIYALQQPNQNNNQPAQTDAQNVSQPKLPETDQIMMRIGRIEDNLNKVMNDLYGAKTQPNQEGNMNKNE